MIYVPNDNHDPRVNLAIENYLLDNMVTDEPILLFYINEPSIIIGRNQNTIEEINQQYVDEHGIHVVRRLSGGGGGYSYCGCLNYSFFTSDGGNFFWKFFKFTEAVVKGLHVLGCEGHWLKGCTEI